ncbi:serine hydrolase domain-containing protein [Nocardia huaxiensis]|uniref:Beta-lactamase family protein n=1 Tax=Nocardia huaxiensis TaxID=2755382 RepID=A0A7D6VD59_9NOCA|nr:serine hydrolase domain-containing protein [Nocardia huaxiensis]QLY33661.1 beta-lactamase family protein [Nocardia huaxiensis]UFS99424.1 beta-lactamase family protein [Nocardia huaxiensis]
MSKVASSPALADLPTGVGGYAAAEFGPLVRTFARRLGGRPGAGAGLTVLRHGEPLVEVWAGEAGPARPWTADTGSVVFSATKGVAATVIHRLANRGLIDYDAPVAAYWPEFGANGKAKITVRQMLSHRSGLSGLPEIAAGLDEVLDHRLMEERLAAAKPDRLLGVPAYHALTYGWLLAGLARAVTGRGMRELFRSEIAEPLGTDGIHLGRPPAGSSTTAATLLGNRLALVGTDYAALFLGHSYSLPGALGALARCLFLPGLEILVEGDEPAVLDTELPAGNGVCTATGLATMYGALANGGMAGGRRYLSEQTLRSMRRIETYRLDHSLLYAPMLWHMGYHSLPIPGAHAGFGHVGLGGSFGWAEPRLGLSVGLVHNRLSMTGLVTDQMASAWVLPLVVRGARAARRTTTRAEQRAA